MCNHHFIFPEDRPENLNTDRETLTGKCKCGAIQKAYGMRWAIQRHENFWGQVPYGETRLVFVDKQDRIW